MHVFNPNLHNLQKLNLILSPIGYFVFFIQKSKNAIKATVHVRAVQNFEIEIFAENKYTLNELLVRKKCFSIRLIVCEI